MRKYHVIPDGNAIAVRPPSGHTNPDKGGGREREPSSPPPDSRPDKPYPPDSIPNPMPGVNPQQTPGIDGVPVEENQGDCLLAWPRTGRYVECGLHRPNGRFTETLY